MFEEDVLRKKAINKNTRELLDTILNSSKRPDIPFEMNIECIEKLVGILKQVLEENDVLVEQHRVQVSLNLEFLNLCAECRKNGGAS
jgi:hypothetical protein